MLNITNRISLSKESKIIVRKFWKKSNGVLDSKSWSKIGNSVKQEFSYKLLVNQKLKCAYCQRRLVGLGHEMDHFAHKANYPRFSFNPVNLFYSCKFCNSAGRKGQKNTVANPSNRYNQIEFSILHPYFDNVDAELIYSDDDRVDFAWGLCSDIAKDTIEFFNFDDSIMTYFRAKVVSKERLEPFTTIEEEEFIQMMIAYR
ncbi:MAG: hypothetical protein ACI83H_002552 [Glaciecola sp.]|jgi:uncharacterized protein (TIGR02646 family)